MNESLAHTIWDEWSSLAPGDAAADEIAGVIDGLSCEACGDEYSFTSSRLFVVRKLMRIWGESKWRGSTEEGSGVRLVHTQQKGRIVFAVSKKTAAEIFAVTQSMAKRTRNWNWVRGLFGSCGSLYIPKTGYYLVLRPPAGNGSTERVRAILKSCGFTVGLRKKTIGQELTLRDQQQIVTLLSRVGLVKTALALEETAIYRSMRNHANKLVNCDAANINKSLEAAQSQMKLIRQMEDLGIADELPSPLRELIYARKRNPSITLKELGQNLPHPISKSTVEYRWRKLEAMLKKHSKGDDANVFRKGRR